MCTIMCVVGGEEGAIDALAKTQNHRGPDSYSVQKDKNVALACQRLAILDIKGGHQPMANESDDVWITHSGEIYNFLELKEELIEIGYIFNTESDTEVVLRAYQEWGSDCITKLNGMFAFVIYDKIKQEVFFARDRFGIKPLHYIRSSEAFHISSEVKGLLKISNDYSIIHDQGLDFYYNCGDETRFSNIKQLPPGTWALLSLNEGSKFKFRTERYHSICENNEFRYGDLGKEQDYANQLYKLLDKSVCKHLRSDVPVGVFTSGGIDSAFVTSLAAKYTKKIQAFTVRVHNDKVYDEYEQAKVITDQLGIPLELVDISECELIKAIPSVIYHLEDYDPRTVEIGLLNYFLAKRAKDTGIQVVLTGEGSDELFCGYRDFFSMPHQIGSISSEKLQTTRVDLLRGLAGNHLLHKDRMCMAHSVEARVPFLENDLVQFALNIDPHLLTKMGAECDRYLLRLAASKEVEAGRMPEVTRLAPKGYAHLKLGVPNVICGHFGIEVKGSIKARYHLYRNIFEQVFLELRDPQEFGKELFESKGKNLNLNITPSSKTHKSSLFAA